MTGRAVAAGESTVGHLPALDGIRALAILAVLFHQFSLFQPEQGLAAQSLSFVARQGAMGVTLFFVLSGFLITRTLLQWRDTPGRYRIF